LTDSHAGSFLRSLTLIFVLIWFSTAAATDPCSQRPLRVEIPLVDASRYCLELLFQDDTGGELSFMALAAARDGVLVTARPLAGEIYRLEDTDGDALPDRAALLIDGLTLPSAVAWDGDTLYVLAASSLYRWQSGELTLMSDALPYSEYGPWNGGLAVSPQGDVFIGISAGCDYCVPESGFGTVMRYSPRDGALTVYAEGFRHPAALVWHDGALWVSDTIRDGIRFRFRDELNRVEQGGHYGFPYCYGRQNIRDTIAGDFDCATASAPAVVFPAQSGPWAAVAYQGAAFPHLDGALLVALNGQPANSDAHGYGLAAVDSRAAADDSDAQYIIPSSEEFEVDSLVNSGLQPRGLGFFPRHVYGVAVSPEGWIYVSAGGGRVYVLREP
jgi:glucose/arabinose dehydrogenase